MLRRLHDPHVDLSVNAAALEASDQVSDKNGLASDFFDPARVAATCLQRQGAANLFFAQEGIYHVPGGVPHLLDMRRRYRSLDAIGGGGSAAVFRGVKYDNHQVAVRMTIGPFDHQRMLEGNMAGTVDPIRWRNISNNTAMASHLSQLSSENGRSICDYFLQPQAVFSVCKPKEFYSHLSPKTWALCEEMDLLDGDWLHLKQVKGSPKFIDDALFFESCVGEWAQHFYGGVTISDDKLRNRGYIVVDYARCYVIEGKCYLFAPGATARRLDLDLYARLPQDEQSSRKKSGLDLFPESMAESLVSSHALSVYQGMQNDITFFAAISTAFSHYIVDHLPESKSVRIYQVTPIERDESTKSG